MRLAASRLLRGPALALFRARFRVLLQYRAAALAGFVTQLFWGLIRVMIFTAFYRGATGAVPMTVAEVTAYIWLSQACFALLPWNVDGELQGLVRSGQVAYELVRPMGLYRQWFFRCLAARTAPPLLRGLPLFFCAWAFFDLPLPADVATAVVWAGSMVGAVLLSAAISTLLNLSLLFLLNGEGISGLSAACVTLFSGMVLPLPLFPDAVRTILDLLPFRGLIDAPFRLYIGHLPLSGAGGVLLHQAVWILLLAAAGHALARRAEARMIIQGG